MNASVAQDVQFQETDADAPTLEKRRFTVSECLKMAELGVLAPNEKLELINGELFKKVSPIGTPHLWCVTRTAKLFEKKLGSQVFVLVQNPIMLDEFNEPEPDIVLLPLIETLERPKAQDALFIVEVCNSTIKTDRKVKLPLYASFGILETWLLNLNDKHLEVYREPKNNAYRQTFIFDETQVVSPLHFPDARFSVAQIIGTKPILI